MFVIFFMVTFIGTSGPGCRINHPEWLVFPETVLVYTFTLLQVVEHKTLFDWIQGLIAVSNYRYTEKANDNKLVLNPPRVGEERSG